MRMLWLKPVRVKPGRKLLISWVKLSTLCGVNSKPLKKWLAMRKKPNASSWWPRADAGALASGKLTLPLPSAAVLACGGGALGSSSASSSS
ncbi:hypothetical protein D3C86_1921740 [compost metagenome]